MMIEMYLNVENIDDLPITNKGYWIEYQTYYELIRCEIKHISEEIDCSDHILWHGIDFREEGIAIHYE